MKTLIATSLILLSFTQFSYSQLINNIGIKGGVTFSNADFKYTSGFDPSFVKPNWGFNGSVFAEFLNSKYFNLVLEPGYEQRGFSFEIIKTDEFGNETGRFNVYNNTHYIPVSVLGKFKFSSSPVSAYFTAGPRLDFYLGYNISYPDGELWNDEEELLENYEKVNFGFTLGAGLELSSIKKFRPFIEANYSPALNKSYETQNLAVKDHYFNIKAGIYIFDFGKKK